MIAASQIEVPEPPAECLGLVLRGTPAMQEVERSIAKWGYAHTEPGAISDTDAAAAGLSVKRGLTLDTLWPNAAEGWAALRGDI